MLAVAWLKMSLVVAKSWSLLSHTHCCQLIIRLLQWLKHKLKRGEYKKKDNIKERRADLYSKYIQVKQRPIV